MMGVAIGQSFDLLALVRQLQPMEKFGLPPPLPPHGAWRGVLDAILNSLIDNLPSQSWYDTLPQNVLRWTWLRNVFFLFCSFIFCLSSSCIICLHLFPAPTHRAPQCVVFCLPATLFLSQVTRVGLGQRPLILDRPWYNDVGHRPLWVYV